MEDVFVAVTEIVFFFSLSLFLNRYGAFVHLFQVKNITEGVKVILGGRLTFER